MECNYFSECGACVDYADGYDGQLNRKLELNIERFSPFYDGNITTYKSLESHYRARSEFKIWHDGDTMRYAMNHISKKGVLFVDECPQVSKHIFALMPKLLKSITDAKIGFKLFGADFLSSSSGDIVVSLLYHRKLDDEWSVVAKKIADELNISIIGRSRKQKITIGDDFIIESLNIANQEYKFKQIENSFTQPNPRVNEKMIEWALDNFSGVDGDLLELYCGAGNFTIPFAKQFNKILATEISKPSINGAKENMALNGVTNIEFVRMSVEEFVEALDAKRIFRRMKDIDINSYELKNIFVDPPRSGMDELSCRYSTRFDNIVYISCNPLTLVRDLEILCETHDIQNMAIFDQFPYTHHVEMGVKLTKKAIL